ncbi:MAG TPA: hypothetical protein VL943_07805 [Niabella sp.]|nr:hypothetical protein [Niabella sp.]
MKKDLIFLLSVISIATLKCTTSKNSKIRDGLTFETAIKVNSVKKEYGLLSKLCPQCKHESQAAISKGKKHYDVITMIKPNGEKVDYYFDLTNFF